DATGSLVEITWVLFQERRQYGASQVRADNNVAIGCGISFCVTLRALSVTAEVISCLRSSGNSADRNEREWIRGRLPSKLELLFRRESDGIGGITDVEIRDDAEHALLLLVLDLHFCQFDLRETDGHLRHLSRN